MRSLEYITLTSKLNRKTHNYIYGVFNGKNESIGVKVDLSKSTNMVFSPKSGIAEKTVEPNSIAIIIQAQKKRYIDDYDVQVELSVAEE